MTTCYSQTHTKYDAWLSREYVNTVVNSECDDVAKYLLPVEGFMTSGDSIYMLTYRGELSLLSGANLIEIKENKYQINNFHYYINLKYVPREKASVYSNSKVYLTKRDNQLLLEFIWENKTDSYFFISRYKDYAFTDIIDSQNYLLETYCPE